MNKKNKFIAVLLSVFFVAAVFFSFLFFAEQREHDCIGADCAVCAVLKIVEDISDGTKKLLAYSVGIFISFNTIYCIFARHEKFLAVLTPVSLHDLLIN